MTTFLLRSYSTLSVASTRSSLTYDYTDTLMSPSNKDASFLNESVEQNTHDNTVREPSPSFDTGEVQNGPEVPAIVVDPSLEQSDVEARLTDGVVVADIDDEEFGGFVSVSNGALNPDPNQSQQNKSVVEVEDTTDEKLNQINEGSLSLDRAETESHVVESESRTETEEKAAIQQKPPEINVVDVSLDGTEQVQTKDVKDPGSTKASKSPKVEKLNQRKGKIRVKGSRKFGRKDGDKEKGKRGKVDVQDDNHSELSYQPDTDLSRSKASKKVNSMFSSFVVTLFYPVSIVQHDLLSKLCSLP